ncbi:MAG TPA: XRE family transcriptional regulator [Burkholderiaceae bacterium]|nr:XRE family transcriptional regulator [Burkholderiaceae bacterium]
MLALRARKRVTLERLAEVTGFTKGYLSKIENSKKVPPIASLARIATALDADIAYFFQTRDGSARSSTSVVHRKDRQRVVRGGTAFGYDYVTLAHNRRNKRMEPFLFSFPRRIAGHVHFKHDGEEFLFILTGRVEFEVNGETYILEEGDSLYFDASLPHRGRALGASAKAIVVTYSPLRSRK